jgi:hypothetical protein
LYPDSFDASDESIVHPSSEALEFTPDSGVSKVDLSVDADISTLQSNTHGVPKVNGGIFLLLFLHFYIILVFPSLYAFPSSLNSRFLFLL